MHIRSYRYIEVQKKKVPIFAAPSGDGRLLCLTSLTESIRISKILFINAKSGANGNARVNCVIYPNWTANKQIKFRKDINPSSQFMINSKTKISKYRKKGIKKHLYPFPRNHWKEIRNQQACSGYPTFQVPSHPSLELEHFSDQCVALAWCWCTGHQVQEYLRSVAWHPS